MTDENRTREIFLRARECAGPEQRREFLHRACQDDPALLAAVESLFRAEDAAGSFLTSPARNPAEVDPNPVGSLVGPYRLLEEIGRGGFGVVYLAEQTEPIQRRVALKIIKAGMDTREVVARFEAERQALAMMDHPGIARVLDAGATPTGRPYFVMELVRGVPITEYCDANHLPGRERLSLFIKVCQAVQHAHQKGVIHRDIKPGNVLVTLHDGEPVPKVIDFGVAKALGPKLTEKTFLTGFYDMIGTPAYMSPEQAGMSDQDIDTRSDIYSLGVLLYELLTGVTPLDLDTLRRAAMDELRRLIREAEPPKPSTRLQQMGPRLTEVAGRRRTEPETWRRAVRGDLDWIVMKALDKDRNRRYDTPAAFAEDLSRHLNHEPVNAAAPGAGYVIRKFVRRHRAGLATAAALLLLLSGGAAVSLWQAVRATRAERVQAELRAQAEAARQAESQLRRIAEARETVARATLLARDGDPAGAEQAIRSVGPLLAEMDSESVASVYGGIGLWRSRQGQWRDAAAAFRLAVDYQPRDFEGWHSRMAATIAAEQFASADSLRLLMLERFAGTTDPLVADRLLVDALVRPWPDAPWERLGRLADVGLKEGPDHRAWRRFQFARGLLDFRRGHHRDAIRWLQDVAQGGEVDRNINRDVAAGAILAMAWRRLNDPAQARASFVTAAAIARDGLPADASGLRNWPAWDDWVLARALMAEARPLIESGASAAIDRPAGDASRAPRGPATSLTILPMRLAGQPFDQLTLVVGLLLEQAGLSDVSLGAEPFDPGPDPGLGDVSARLRGFVREHPVSTRLVLYGEYNGGPVDGVTELRWILADSTGQVARAEQVTKEDPAFRRLENRDPMTVTMFLVERLSPYFALTAETRKNARPGKMAALMEARTGIPAEADNGAMEARETTFRAAAPSLTLDIYPIRMNGAEDSVAARALVTMVNESGVCRARLARLPHPLELPPPQANEARTLWDMARAFREACRASAPAGDYGLYADCYFTPGRWEQGYAHFAVCDRAGDWVLVDLENSEHPDYQGIKPMSAEACTRLLARRLTARLH